MNNMADLTFTQTVSAMRSTGVTAHSKTSTPNIWELAARNNRKQKQVIYRINGQRVSKSEFEAFKNA